ncbi:MAG: DUF2871 domain-containing protein [Clostridiales bacterium]|nr:DUF2871 domain-containing protein [Clostridiales bacterium]
MKKYMNLSIVYAIIAMVFGVFYREFTKFSGFSGRTTLSFIHGHYLVLGMGFFLMLVLVEKLFGISQSKNFGKTILFYQIGLNISVAAFLTRGIIQVKNLLISNAFDAALSGVAGIGHILLGISLLIALFTIKKKVV